MQELAILFAVAVFASAVFAMIASGLAPAERDRDRRQRLIR